MCQNVLDKNKRERGEVIHIQYFSIKKYQILEFKYNGHIWKQVFNNRVKKKRIEIIYIILLDKLL